MPESLPQQDDLFFLLCTALQCSFSETPIERKGATHIILSHVSSLISCMRTASTPKPALFAILIAAIKHYSEPLFTHEVMFLVHSEQIVSKALSMKTQRLYFPKPMVRVAKARKNLHVQSSSTVHRLLHASFHIIRNTDISLHKDGLTLAMLLTDEIMC